MSFNNRWKVATLLAVMMLVGCGGLKGIYKGNATAEGMFGGTKSSQIEFTTDANCVMTFGDNSVPCTYLQKGDRILVTLGGNGGASAVMELHRDGNTLTGKAQGFTISVKKS